MKKIFSLVLALVMALSLTTVAWGVPTGTGTQADPYVVGNEADFIAAVANDNCYVELSGQITITGSVSIDKTVTIDVAAVTASNDAIKVVTGGTLTLGQNVTITGAAYASGGLIYVNGGTVNVNGATISATSGNGTVVYVDNSGALNVNGGSITSVDGKCIAVTGATATIKGGTITSQNNSAAYIKETNGGTLNIAGGTVSTDDGADFAAVFGYSGTINVTGGTIKNTNSGNTSYALVASGTNAVVNVSGGNVQSVGVHPSNGGDANVTGGTFDVPASAEPYLADGLTLTTDGVVVSEGGAVLGAKYDMVTTDIAATKTVGVTVNTYAAKAPKDTNKDGLLDQVGNVKYVEFSNMPGVAFVQVNSVSDADYTVYQTGTKTVFGYFAAVVSPEYLGNGVPFTAFGDDCLEFDIEPVPGAKYYFFQGVVYKADPSFTSPINLMVGSTLTPVVAENVANWVQHTPAYTYDKDYKVVGVKCAECGTDAVIYPNFAAVPKADKAKAVQVNDDDYYVWLAGPVADTETKVESAETFDAGIAMYVGMSVMAAAGSAVVIGKKKD